MFETLFKDISKKNMLTHDEYLKIAGIIAGSIGSFIAGLLIFVLFRDKGNAGRS